MHTVVRAIKRTTAIDILWAERPLDAKKGRDRCFIQMKHRGLNLFELCPDGSFVGRFEFPASQ